MNNSQAEQKTIQPGEIVVARRRILLGVGGLVLAGASAGAGVTYFFGPSRNNPEPRLLNVSYSERPDTIELPSILFRGDPTAGKSMSEWKRAAIVGMRTADKEAARDEGLLPAAVFWTKDPRTPSGRLAHVANLGDWDNVGQVGSSPNISGVGFLLGRDELEAGIAAVSTSGVVAAPWELEGLGIHALSDMAKNFRNVGIA